MGGHEAEQQRLSEADARRLIERAIELDAKRSSEATVAELRHIAEELRISPAAFDDALRELRVLREQSLDLARAKQLASTKRWLGVLRSVILLSAGYLAAALSRFQDLPTMAALLVIPAALLAWADRERRPLAANIADLTILWFGVAIGVFLQSRALPIPRGMGGPLPNAITMVLGWFGGCAAAALVRWFTKRSSDDSKEGFAPHNATRIPKS